MEDGVKRKLPPWMSRVNVAGNTVGQAETEKRVRIEKDLEDETASQSLHPNYMIKTKPLKKDTCSRHETLDYEPNDREGMILNQGAEVERSSTEACETLVERKKGNSCGRKFKNKRKGRSHDSSQEIESPPNEVDGDLTVEDLLTIAQEYVRRDENFEQQQLSDESHDGKTNSAIALSVHDVEGLPFVPSRIHKEPYMPKEEIHVHNSIARTEDPAQDMLDLFLGPLLKKSVSDDRRIKTIEEDRTFVREVKEQLHDNSIALADLVPLTKKKSSLKDKVAMLFD